MLMWLRILTIAVPTLIIVGQYGVIKYKNNHIEQLSKEIKDKDKEIKGLKEIILRHEKAVEGAKKNAQESQRKLQQLQKSKSKIRNTKQASNDPLSGVVVDAINSLYLESREVVHQ
jgi:septal ring factor EnvC (AmiA/AmiB activator)